MLTEDDSSWALQKFLSDCQRSDEIGTLQWLAFRTSRARMPQIYYSFNPFQIFAEGTAQVVALQREFYRGFQEA